MTDMGAELPQLGIAEKRLTDFASGHTEADVNFEGPLGGCGPKRPNEFVAGLM
jgi:hypothetical protein